MAEALKKRTVQKYYRCIVKGEVKEKTHLKGYLSKDESANKVTIRTRITPDEKADYLPIETEYRPVQVSNGYTELEVHLITGRSHQIRAHLASIGHPIIGDVKYGDRGVNEHFRREAGIRSQMLHSWKLVFPQMDTPLDYLSGKSFTAPVQGEFQKVLGSLPEEVR